MRHWPSGASTDFLLAGSCGAVCAELRAEWPQAQSTNSTLRRIAAPNVFASLTKKGNYETLSKGDYRYGTHMTTIGLTPRLSH